MANTFTVLGVHDEDVKDVQGNSLRVRLFIGDEKHFVDEDFPLPALFHPSVPRTLEVYTALLAPDIEKRMDAIAADAASVTLDEVDVVADPSAKVAEAIAMAAKQLVTGGSTVEDAQTVAAAQMSDALDTLAQIYHKAIDDAVTQLKKDASNVGAAIAVGGNP